MNPSIVASWYLPTIPLALAFKSILPSHGTSIHAPGSIFSPVRSMSMLKLSPFGATTPFIIALPHDVLTFPSNVMALSVPELFIWKLTSGGICTSPRKGLMVRLKSAPILAWITRLFHRNFSISSISPNVPATSS